MIKANGTVESVHKIRHTFEKEKKKNNIRNNLCSLPSMKEGEEFYILDGDNDGWTLVQRMSGEDGYVPTSFLTIS